MVAKAILPSRFPVGTRFVVEGRAGKRGTVKVTQRCLIMPDGTQYRLLDNGRASVVTKPHSPGVDPLQPIMDGQSARVRKCDRDRRHPQCRGSS